MNAKKCKRLRKYAQSVTVGAPNVAYRVIQHRKQNPRFNPLDPTSMEPFTIIRPQVVLDARCTRAVYHSFKKFKRLEQKPKAQVQA